MKVKLENTKEMLEKSYKELLRLDLNNANKQDKAKLDDLDKYLKGLISRIDTFIAKFENKYLNNIQLLYVIKSKTLYLKLINITEEDEKIITEIIKSKIQHELISFKRYKDYNQIAVPAKSTYDAMKIAREIKEQCTNLSIQFKTLENIMPHGKNNCISTGYNKNSKTLIIACTGDIAKALSNTLRDIDYKAEVSEKSIWVHEVPTMSKAMSLIKLLNSELQSSSIWVDIPKEL